jgi:hypothetical protein
MEKIIETIFKMTEKVIIIDGKILILMVEVGKITIIVIKMNGNQIQIMLGILIMMNRNLILPVLGK